MLAFNRIATDPDEPAPEAAPGAGDDAAGKSPPGRSWLNRSGPCPDPGAAEVLAGLRQVGAISRATGVDAGVWWSKHFGDLIPRLTPLAQAILDERAERRRRDAMK